MGFVQAMENVFRGLGSLFETGSWKVTEAADEARDAETLLSRVDEEVEQNAQRTLDQVNDALTYYGKLERDRDRLQAQVDDWASKAKTAADKAKSFAEDSADRAKWTGLARSALMEKGKFGSQLEIVTKALAAAKPDADKALSLVEEIGFTKEQALSQRATLQVANATAQAKLSLADARKTWGQGNAPGKLLDEARQKVDAAMAKAAAGEMIEDATPQSADTLAATIDREAAKSSVDAELAALMA